MSIYPRIAHAHAHAHATVAHHTRAHAHAHAHAHTHAAGAANIRRPVLVLAVMNQNPAAAGLRVQDVLVAGFWLAKIVHLAGRVATMEGCEEVVCDGKDATMELVVGKESRE